MLRYRIIILSLIVFTLSSGCWAAPAKSVTKTPADNAAQAKVHFKKAVDLHKAGKLDAALKEYRILIKLDPNSPAPLSNMGLIYIQKKEYDNAKIAFERVLAINPRDEFAIENLAGVLMAQGKSREALKYARKLIGIKPKDHGARFILGMVNLRLKDYDAAADAFKAAIHIKPDDVVSIYNLGFCYLNLKQYGDALETMERVIKLDPGNGQAAMVAASAAEEINDNTTAIKYYELASKVSSTSVAALTNLYRLYTTSGKEEKGVDVLKRILAVDKNNFAANFNLGRYQYSKKQYKEAEGSFAAAKRAIPGDVGANLNLALVQVMLKKFDQAKSNINIVLKKEPKNKPALEVSAYVEEIGGNLDDAIKLYQKWEKYYPNDSTPNRKAASVYLYQRNTDKALAQFDVALKKDPKNHDLIIAYADALRSGQSFDKAYAMYDKALKLEPDVANTMVSAAICLQKTSKLDEAIALLNKAIKADSKHEAAYTILADVYKAQNKPDLAIEQYKKIVEFSPKNISALQAIATIYGTQGNYDAEIETYRKLHDADPQNIYYVTKIPAIYEKAGKLDLAIDEAKKLVEANPRTEAYRSTLADLLVKKQDYDGALAQYAELTNSSQIGTKAQAWFQTAGIQEKQGKPEDAVSSYKKVVDISPSDPRALDALSKIYHDQKKTGEFHTYLRSLIESGKDDLPYRYFLTAFKKANKNDEAIKTLEDISSKNPDNTQIMSVLAAAYTETDLKDKAIDEYKKILVKKKDDPWAAKSLGDIYKATGRDQEAADNYAIAVNAMPFDLELIRDLAELYEKLGNKPDALKAYKDFLKIDPANLEIRNKVRSLEIVK